MKKRILTILLAAVFALAALPTLARADDVNNYPVLITNFNGKSVQNDPDKDVSIILKANAIMLRSLTTYHWNGGSGAEPGTIGLYDNTDKKMVGTWNAQGREGNTYWDVFPHIMLEKGHSYQVVDSSAWTWSWNSTSDGLGFVEVRGGDVVSKTATQYFRSIRLYLNGRQIVPMDSDGVVVEPFIIDGTTYLPLRAVASNLGCSVGWDDRSSTITLSHQPTWNPTTGTTSGRSTSKKVTQFFRGIRILLDGNLIIPKDSDGVVVDPFIIDGTTYMPVRALADALGASVDWDSATSSVIITFSGGGYQ